MQEIKSVSLVHFQPDCELHQKVLSKVQNYPFHKNLDLIKKFLTKMEFTGGVSADDEDFYAFVTFTTLMVMHLNIYLMLTMCMLLMTTKPLMTNQQD